MPNQESQKYIETDRRRADEAVAVERSRMDTAIQKEQASDSLGDLLLKERESTDRRLLDERAQADSEAERSSTLLSEEVVAHGRTKSALTTRDEFLAIVSHDLRNPIGTIASCAQMLLEDYPDVSPEERQWIALIKRNADSALRLIADLLDMERISIGKLDLKFELHDVGGLLREAVESFVHAASAKSILLRALAPEEPIAAVFDRDRIMQVLSNLIGNALKFTPEGGAIVLKSERRGEEVWVTVSDNGPGIPAEKQSSIFERFAQINVRDRRGLGLGLYISKMLLEAHGGRIWVQSSVGKGSAFTFALPMRPSALQ